MTQRTMENELEGCCLQMHMMCLDDPTCTFGTTHVDSCDENENKTQVSNCKATCDSYPSVCDQTNPYFDTKSEAFKLPRHSVDFSALSDSFNCPPDLSHVINFNSGMDLLTQCDDMVEEGEGPWFLKNAKELSTSVSTFRKSLLR